MITVGVLGQSGQELLQEVDDRQGVADLGRDKPGRPDIEVGEPRPDGRDPQHHGLPPEGVVLLEQAHLDELPDPAVCGPGAAATVLPSEEPVGDMLPGHDPVPADPVQDRPVPVGDHRA